VRIDTPGNVSRPTGESERLWPVILIAALADSKSPPGDLDHLLLAVVES
jgi:hypothetical protein